jgi:hypothetical protein
MSKPTPPSTASVIRIKPCFYIHVLDNNTNVTRVVVGPRTFTRQDHETIVAGPEPMITIPPRHYCVIANPVVRYLAVNCIEFCFFFLFLETNRLDATLFYFCSLF